MAEGISSPQAMKFSGKVLQIKIFPRDSVFQRLTAELNEDEKNSYLLEAPGKCCTHWERSERRSRPPKGLA